MYDTVCHGRPSQDDVLHRLSTMTSDNHLFNELYTQLYGTLWNCTFGRKVPELYSGCDRTRVANCPVFPGKSRIFGVCVSRPGLYLPGTQNVPYFQVLWRMLGFLLNTKHQGTEIS